jgi:hypothetical protein
MLPSCPELLWEALFRLLLFHRPGLVATNFRVHPKDLGGAFVLRGVGREGFQPLGERQRPLGRIAFAAGVQRHLATPVPGYHMVLGGKTWPATVTARRTRAIGELVAPRTQMRGRQISPGECAALLGEHAPPIEQAATLRALTICHAKDRVRHLSFFPLLPLPIVMQRVLEKYHATHSPPHSTTRSQLGRRTIGKSWSTFGGTHGPRSCRNMRSAAAGRSRSG